MGRTIYFIGRRGPLFLLIFLSLSFLLYDRVDKKEVFYKATGRITFVGIKGSFSPALEAERIKQEDFLKEVSRRVKGTDTIRLRENLEINMGGETLLLISFISNDPKTAKDVVETVCNIFIRDREATINDTRTKEKARLKVLSDELDKAKYRLNAYRKKLMDMKDKNKEKDETRKELQSRLSDLKLQEQDLLRLYTQKHPTVMALAERIATVESQLVLLPDNSAQYARLNTKIEEEEAAVSVSQKECDYVYNSSKERPEDWSLQLIGDISLPTHPIGKDKGWYYKLGLPVIFFVALLVAIGAELLDKRIYTIEELEAAFRLPLIAKIGRVDIVRDKGIKNNFFKKRLLLNNKRGKRLLRSYEELYTFLRLEIFKGRSVESTLLITSAEKATGKTFVASNLALAVAKGGEKVLLIDANFRFPCIHTVFGFSRNTKGLSDILKGSCGYKEAVRNLTDILLAGNLKLKEEELKGLDNLRVLPLGTIYEDPSELLETKRLTELFKELNKDYGLLIIDTAALRGYADTLNIIPAANASLLVVRKAKTTYPLLRNAIKQINNIRGLLVGLVFSHV